jgi:hypothetical protein
MVRCIITSPPLPPPSLSCKWIGADVCTEQEKWRRGSTTCGSRKCAPVFVQKWKFTNRFPPLWEGDGNNPSNGFRNGPSIAYGLKHVIIGYLAIRAWYDKKTTDFATILPILPYFTIVVYMKLFACDNFTNISFALQNMTWLMSS